jgi:hypothetical protein
MSIDESFLVLLAYAIEQVKLEAVVVGMSAAALHGAPVLTQDVDLLVRDTPVNQRKVRALAKAIGAAEALMQQPLAPVATIIGADAPVDIVFDHLPGALSFASVRSRSERIAVGARFLRVASLADIIASKKATGRPKDKAQMPILEAALAVKKQP